MFFDSFKEFYEEYKDIINQKGDIKIIKSFWNRYCFVLRKMCSYRDKIIYKDELNDITYTSFIDKGKIIVRPSIFKPSTLINNNCNDFFTLNIGENLMAFRYKDSNIIIEKFSTKKNYLLDNEIKLYDRDATNYILKDDTIDFTNIVNVKNIISSKGLLPDKKVTFYHNNHSEIRVNIYKKEEIFDSIILKDELYQPSIFQTVLEMDELLSDLNKDKVKKL